jgi:hypothetical protein
MFWAAGCVVIMVLIPLSLQSYLLFEDVLPVGGFDLIM